MLNKLQNVKVGDTTTVHSSNAVGNKTFLLSTGDCFDDSQRRKPRGWEIASGHAMTFTKEIASDLR